MPLEHSDNCLFLLREGECNCYISENEDLLGSKQAVFKPATREGPDDIYSHPDEAGWVAIREFVAQKLNSARVDNPRLLTQNAYSPLQKNEIRILELKQGHFDDPLHGSLHVVNIDFAYPRINDHWRTTNHAISLPEAKPVWYTALSYTWGPPIFDIQFQLTNNTSIQITSTLGSALKHLRRDKDNVFLWIDQVCINQDDISEKQEQIPLMGMIYSHATNTVIWLGDEGDDNPQLAFDTLQTVHSRLQLFAGEIGPNDFERLDFPAAPAHEWMEVKKIYSRPWFGRLWVVQEAVLSRNLYVKCGKVVVAWDDFALWCTTMESCGLRAWMEGDAPVPVIQSGLVTTYELSTFRSIHHTSGERYPLLECLVLTRYTNASIAKDKVYGVLGIARPQTTQIQPQYSEAVSARDVFLEAGLAVPPVDLFRLLYCVDHASPVSPSWIPDWTLPRATKSLGYSTSSWSLYSACGPMFDPATGKAYPITCTLEDSNRSLVIPGIIFDTVATLGEPLDEEPFVLTMEGRIHGNPHWLHYVSMVKAITSYPTGENVWDAFWQTLVAGKDGSSFSYAPQEYSDILSLIVDECHGEKQRISGQAYSPRRQKGFFTLKSLASRKPKLTLDDMTKALRAALHWRRFAITKKGFFCLVPRLTNMNDTVVILQGGHVPFVVRSQGGTNESFELIGETYVHGIMRGEAFDLNHAVLESVKLV